MTSNAYGNTDKDKNELRADVLFANAGGDLIGVTGGAGMCWVCLVVMRRFAHRVGIQSSIDPRVPGFSRGPSRCRAGPVIVVQPKTARASPGQDQRHVRCSRNSKGDIFDDEIRSAFALSGSCPNERIRVRDTAWRR